MTISMKKLVEFIKWETKHRLSEAVVQENFRLMVEDNREWKKQIDADIEATNIRCEDKPK